MEDRVVSLNAVLKLVNDRIGNYYIAEAIKRLPSVSQAQPCEDAISRVEALRIVATEYEMKKIRELPSVQPQIASDCVGRKYIVHEVERPQGRWFGIEDEEMEIVGYYCSECDWGSDEETNFCPNCGARMEGNNNEMGNK